MNPYESGARKVIPASLVYARSDGHILMLHRNAGGERGLTDVHRGKWNGLGGKFEPGESPLEAARREVREECGLDLAPELFVSLGVLHFPDFRAAKREDWVVFLFSVETKEEVRPGLLKTGPEGDLHWVAQAKVLELPLWEGDRLFLPHILDRRPVVGTFWYEAGKLARHWLQPL